MPQLIGEQPSQCFESGHVHISGLVVASYTGEWPGEKASPNVMEYLQNRLIDLVVNIPKNLSKHELDNDYSIRRSAVDCNIPLITNPNLAAAFIMAFCKIRPGEIEIKSWDEY